jgi:hypothetical protein
MTDLSTLPVPEGCPFVYYDLGVKVFDCNGEITWLSKAITHDRFIICATMTAWLAREIDYCASDESLEQLGALHNKWSAAEAEAYAAMKE